MEETFGDGDGESNKPKEVFHLLAQRDLGDSTSDLYNNN
jgi:hypothetical protein